MSLTNHTKGASRSSDKARATFECWTNDTGKGRRAVNIALTVQCGVSRTVEVLSSEGVCKASCCRPHPECAEEVYYWHRRIPEVAGTCRACLAGLGPCPYRGPGLRDRSGTQLEPHSDTLLHASNIVLSPGATFHSTDTRSPFRLSRPSPSGQLTVRVDPPDPALLSFLEPRTTYRVGASPFTSPL